LLISFKKEARRGAAKSKDPSFSEEKEAKRLLLL
jgi:hypothetical protein